jgi:N utilization substance protein B
MSRRAARESALKVLYQMDIGKIDQLSALQAVVDEDALDNEDRIYTEGISSGVSGNLQEIDALLKRFAVGWHLGRMAAIDRNVLRIAVYELAFAEPRIPVGVALNEAVELAKTFGDAESGKFVNGVLANIVKGLQLTGSR